MQGNKLEKISRPLPAPGSGFWTFGQDAQSLSMSKGSGSPAFIRTSGVVHLHGQDGPWPPGRNPRVFPWGRILPHGTCLTGCRRGNQKCLRQGSKNLAETLVGGDTLRRGRKQQPLGGEALATGGHVPRDGRLDRLPGTVAVGGVSGCFQGSERANGSHPSGLLRAPEATGSGAIVRASVRRAIHSAAFGRPTASRTRIAAAG
jgi:hypothetical protein